MTTPQSSLAGQIVLQLRTRSARSLLVRLVNSHAALKQLHCMLHGNGPARGVNDVFNELLVQNTGVM